MHCIPYNFELLLTSGLFLLSCHCPDNDIDPKLAINFAAEVERENAESIVEHRFANFLYFGQTNNHNQPHGYGIAFFDDGSKYIGLWLRGNYYGYGIFVSTDPALPFEYRGQFYNGRMSGCGMLRLQTSRDVRRRLTQREIESAYVGEFKDVRVPVPVPVPVRVCASVCLCLCLCLCTWLFGRRVRRRR